MLPCTSDSPLCQTACASWPSCYHGQVVTYAYALLEQLPTHRRSRVYAGLTNLKTIVFIRVDRTAQGSWSYAVDDARDSDVLSALCAVLLTPLAQVSSKHQGASGTSPVVHLLVSSRVSGNRHAPESSHTA